jgi:hypothetical protein
MLEHLIALTNSPAFVDRGDLLVVDVHCRPAESADVFLTLDVRLEDEHTFEETLQRWQVRCLEATYGWSNSLRDYKRPYNQLRVYADHPVLFNYAHGVELEVKGACPNVPELLGTLYEAHGQACGHWVDFAWQFSHLADHLRAYQRADLVVPTPLLDVCSAVFSQYGLTHTIQGSLSSAWLNSPLHALIFSNPLVCPDDFNLQQPYQVAQGFEEQRVE